MNPPAPRHLVVLPSYNTGPVLARTVAEALASWPDVLVVVDGSTDGSANTLPALAATHRGLSVTHLPRNRGKGAAIHHGLRWARTHGYTHILTMDADGQHPAEQIGRFIKTSRSAPAAMILGRPVFADDAPALRVQGRRVSNWWARLETPGSDIGDSLFGFRVYPAADLLAVMDTVSGMRRYDFDPEAAVRLCWRGLDCVNLDSPVRYLSRDEGGISHFHYLRDNLLLIRMHVRLMIIFLGRLLLRPLRRRAARA